MTPRFHLFGKIFSGFWLATIAVLGSWLVSSHYFDTGPDRGELEYRTQGQPQRFVMRMIYDLQNLDDRAMRAAITAAGTEHDVDIFLLDNRGEDLLGRAVPPNVEAVSRQLQGIRRRAFLRSGGEHLLAHEIYRPGTGMLRAVFVFRPSRHRLLGLLGSNLWLRIGLAVVISGAICYLLSTLLTRRIKSLQLASRQLANGRLDTRLRVRQLGGDETDELARDFNSMAEQLQERIESQKRLLGDVSHELRSPLARLRIALALAQEQPQGTRTHLARIERETERLEELIGQLLDSQGPDTALDDHIDLVPLLQQLCSDAKFEGAAQSKRVTLATHLPEAIVASTGDLLHKCFENILRNALNHTPPDSDIEVRLAQTGDEYRVQVSDCGGGVPARELARIFEAFYRTDTARTRDTGGHGMGLAIARRAIGRHGGQIWAENTAQGLAVIVILPCPGSGDSGAKINITGTLTCDDGNL